MKKLLEKLKTSKDFRYDFFIGVWSAVIVVFILVALVVVISHASKNVNNEQEATQTPIPTEDTTAAPTQEASPEPTEDILDGDDWYDSTDVGVDDDDTMYTTDNVNVRADASISAESYGTLTAGSSVKVKETLDNGWTKVEYEGKTAYIKTEFLTKRSSATMAPMDYYSNNESEQTSPSSTKDNETAKPKATKTPKPKATKKAKATKKPSNDSVTQNQHIETPTEQPVQEQPTQAPAETDNSDNQNTDNKHSEEKPTESVATNPPEDNLPSEGPLTEPTDETLSE